MSPHDLILFFLQVSLMLAAAVVFGQLVRKLGQPVVLGEIIGGILLGPSFFGVLAPNLHAWLFPTAGITLTVRDTVIKLGMLFFLFVAGLEVDITHLRRRGWRIVWISVTGIVVPFSLGFGLVRFFPGVWGLQTNNTPIFALFIGTALSISALPLIARILMDLDMIKEEIGMVVMAAATIDDLVGWALFAVILGNFVPGKLLDSFMVGPWTTPGLVLVFFILFLTIGRWAAQRSLGWLQNRLTWPSSFIGVMIVLILAAAAVSELIGIHSIFGAFLVGVAFARKSEKRDQAHEMVYQFVVSFFAPIYFVSIGLQVDFTTNFDLPLVLLVLVIACAGKIGGATLGALMGKMPFKESLAVGFGMNARGMMEMILASVAYEHKVIDQRVFIALIVMALVTSILSGPMMQRLLKITKTRIQA